MGKSVRNRESTHAIRMLIFIYKTGFSSSIPPPHNMQGTAPPARPQTVVQKTKLVRNSCHVRKDTVSFKREDKAGGRYQMSFRFDADVPCKVFVYLVATESKDADGRLR